MITDPQSVADYMKLRSMTEHIWKSSAYGSRVFWQYRVDTQASPPSLCFRAQPIGKTYFYKYPKRIAKFIGLPKVMCYRLFVLFVFFFLIFLFVLHAMHVYCTMAK